MLKLAPKRDYAVTAEINKEGKKMATAKDFYHGKKIIILGSDGPFQFRFGLQKAKMIMESIEEIKAFIKEEEAENV